MQFAHPPRHIVARPVDAIASADSAHRIAMELGSAMLRDAIMAKLEERGKRIRARQ